MVITVGDKDGEVTGKSGWHGSISLLSLGVDSHIPRNTGEGYAAARAAVAGRRPGPGSGCGISVTGRRRPITQVFPLHLIPRQPASPRARWAGRSGISESPRDGSQGIGIDAESDAVSDPLPLPQGVTFLGGKPFAQAAALAERGSPLQLQSLSVVTFGPTRRGKDVRVKGDRRSPWPSARGHDPSREPPPLHGGARPGPRRRMRRHAGRAGGSRTRTFVTDYFVPEDRACSADGGC